MYTTPEIAAAFNESRPAMSAAMKFYARVNFGVKSGKTVWSVAGQIRNFISNPMIELANGNWRAVFNVGKAARAVAGDLSAPTEVLAERLSKLAGSERDWRAYWLDLQRRNIVGQSTSANELRDLLLAASNRSGKIADAFADPTSSTFRKGVAVVGKLYSGNDDFYKILAWEGELADYRNALPNVPDEAIKDRVAKLVTDTRPTYAKVPRITQRLRQNILIGNFVSWQSEIIRNTYNIGRYAIAELRDPALRGIGARRLAGLAAVASVVPALAAYSRFTSGVTKDEENDMRPGLPFWQRNAHLAHYGRDEKGSYKFKDMSFADPYSYFRKAIVAIMRGEDGLDGFKDAAVEMFSPFVAPEILISAADNVWNNQRERGSPARIYNPQDDGDKILMDVIAYMGTKVEPGTVSSLRRIKMGQTGELTRTGQSFDRNAEIRAMLTGSRIGTYNPAVGLYHILNDLNQKVSDQNQRFTSTLGDLGNVAPETIKERYQDISKGRMELFKEASDAIHAHLRLGVSNAQAGATAKQAGWTEKEIESIVNGRVPFYSPSDQLAKSFRARAERSGMAKPQIDSIIKARGSAYQEERQRLLPRP